MLAFVWGIRFSGGQLLPQRLDLRVGGAALSRPGGNDGQKELDLAAAALEAGLGQRQRRGRSDELLGLDAPNEQGAGP